MSDWLKLFAQDLAASVDPPPKLEFRTGPPRAIVIAAAHEEVGDLVIHEDGVDDEDELTVVVGRLFHAHFFPGTSDRDGGPPDDRSFTAEAATFVDDVLADRLYFCDHYKGDQVVGGEYGVVGENAPMYPIQARGKAIPRREIRSRTYLWSGPVDRLPLPPDGAE